MRKNRFSQDLDVIRNHVVPAICGSEGLGGANKCEGAAHADTEPNLNRRPGRIDQSRDVVVDGWIHVDCARRLRQLGDLCGRDDLGNGDPVRLGDRTLENSKCRRVVGVPDRRLHEKAVELGLRQAVRARLFDRILRRNDHERLADRMGNTVNRHPGLFHDLEQRCLGLRACPVYLIRKHDVGEYWSRMKLEGARSLVVDADTGDIPGQQVRCELDATGRTVHGLGHRPSQRGLSGSGEVFEEQVPLAEERREAQTDDERLAKEHLLDVRYKTVERFGERRRLFGSHGHSGLLVIVVPVVRSHIMVAVRADRDRQRREVLAD